MSIENSKKSFALKIIVKNSGFLAILFTINVGLWTIKLSLFHALTGQAGSISVTIWCWIFIVGWIIYFYLVFNKAYLQRKEKIKNASEEAARLEKEKKELAEKEQKEASELALKTEKEEKDRQDQITFRNETDQKLSKLTEDQAKEFKSVNSQIEEVKTIQAALEGKIQSNQASLEGKIEENQQDVTSKLKELYVSIDAFHDKMAPTRSADDDKILDDNSGNYSNQFSQESIRRMSSYSSKSL